MWEYTTQGLKKKGGGGNRSIMSSGAPFASLTAVQNHKYPNLHTPHISLFTFEHWVAHKQEVMSLKMLAYARPLRLPPHHALIVSTQPQ